jgi:hypothetical protein
MQAHHRLIKVKSDKKASAMHFAIYHFFKEKPSSVLV